MGLQSASFCKYPLLTCACVIYAASTSVLASSTLSVYTVYLYIYIQVRSLSVTKQFCN